MPQSADNPHFAFGRCGPCDLALKLHKGCYVSGDARVVKETSASDRAANYQKMLKEKGQQPKTATEVIFQASVAQSVR